MRIVLYLALLILKSVMDSFDKVTLSIQTKQITSCTFILMRKFYTSFRNLQNVVFSLQIKNHNALSRKLPTVQQSRK